jgi:hypothetical protein
MLRVALALLVAACGGSRVPTPVQPHQPVEKVSIPVPEVTIPAGEAAQPGGGTGDVGAVCSCNPDRADACRPVECKPELVCGYPCGISGCNSTCMTRQQFGQSMSIP